MPKPLMCPEKLFGWPLNSPNPHAHDSEVAVQLEKVGYQLTGFVQ